MRTKALSLLPVLFCLAGCLDDATKIGGNAKSSGPDAGNENGLSLLPVDAADRCEPIACTCSDGQKGTRPCVTSKIFRMKPPGQWADVVQPDGCVCPEPRLDAGVAWTPDATPPVFPDASPDLVSVLPDTALPEIDAPAPLPDAEIVTIAVPDARPPTLPTPDAAPVCQEKIINVCTTKADGKTCRGQMECRCGTCTICLAGNDCDSPPPAPLPDAGSVVVTPDASPLPPACSQDDQCTVNVGGKTCLGTKLCSEGSWIGCYVSDCQLADAGTPEPPVDTRPAATPDSAIPDTRPPCAHPVVDAQTPIDTSPDVQPDSQTLAPDLAPDLTPDLLLPALDTSPDLTPDTEPPACTSTTTPWASSLTATACGTCTIAVNWQLVGCATYGYKVVWSKTPGPEYPGRSGKGDHYQYMQSPSANHYSLSVDSSGTWYIRVCLLDLQDGTHTCLMYSNEISVVVPG